MDLEGQIQSIASKARHASSSVARLPTGTKNRLLIAMAERLIGQKDQIERVNAADVEAASKNLTKGGVDRLILDAKRITEMAQGLRDVAGLPDPVGAIVREWERPNGMKVRKVRIPIGVIGIIYESRPNVTVDAAGLCLKSGNAVVLRGGSEAIRSNMVLGEIMRGVCSEEGIDPDIIQVVPMTERAAMEALVRQVKYIDLLIPRGGEGLMKWIVENARIPVIKHDKGVCHVYVDKDADPEMALDIVFNSKVQRPAVCNAAETLLVHRDIASKFLPLLEERFKSVGVEMRGCERSCSILPDIKRATEGDWHEEYLDLILAVRVVDSLDEAISHIEKYGSMHTESIVTEDSKTAERFLREVNSSGVFWNASTRLNDGGQLGLGAEIGISTTKVGAFGPMGVEELTAMKYVVLGTGQLRT